MSAPDFQPPPPFNWLAAGGCALMLAGMALWALAGVGGLS